MDVKEKNTGRDRQNGGRTSFSELLRRTGYDRRKTIGKALSQSLPVMFSYFVISFAFGVSLEAAGYRPITAFLMSVFIYSGTLQLALVPMLMAGISLPVIAVSAFLMTSRHMFYGIGYTDRFNTYGPFKPYMIYTYTDEIYGIFSSTDYEKDVDPVWADILTSMFCRWCWIGGSVIGAIAGDVLPLDFTGVDFAITCLFTCSLVGQWKDTPSHLNILLAVITGVICLMCFGADNFILPALSFTLIGLLLIRKRIEPGKEA